MKVVHRALEITGAPPDRNISPLIKGQTAPRKSNVRKRSITVDVEIMRESIIASDIKEYVWTLSHAFRLGY